MGLKLTVLQTYSIWPPFSLLAMRGNGAKTLRAAIFSGGHFGTADQLFLKHRYAEIGKRNSLPIVAKQFFTIKNIVMRSQKWSQKIHHYADSLLNGVPIKRGITVLGEIPGGSEKKKKRRVYLCGAQRNKGATRGIATPSLQLFSGNIFMSLTATRN